MDLFDDDRLTATGLLFEAHDGLIAKLEPVWRESGLSGLDLEALIRLGRSPGRRLRLSDLAAQTRLSTSGVTRLVDRLERNGLARRESDPGDRRSVHAVLTEEGAARLEEVLPRYFAAIDRWFTGVLPPHQMLPLLEGLRTLRDAVFAEAAP